MRFRLRVVEIGSNAIGGDFSPKFMDPARVGQPGSETGKTGGGWVDGLRSLAALRCKCRWLIVREEPDPLATAMGALQCFLVKQAALALAGPAGVTGHGRSAAAAVRRDWLLMAAW